MKNGEAPLPPSWEQLLTGVHPSFRTTASAERGGRGPARHGRGRWSAAGEPVDPIDDPIDDPGQWPEDDAMGWRDAVLWTVAAAGVALLLASRAGGLLP